MGAFVWFAGIPVVQLVAGSRVSTSTDEGFALALSDSGDVYSWGKGYKGRLGHSSTENVRSPKMVDALGGKDIKMVRVSCLVLIDVHHEGSILSCLLVFGDTTSYHAYYTDTSQVLCHLIHILSLIYTHMNGTHSF